MENIIEGFDSARDITSYNTSNFSFSIVSRIAYLIGVSGEKFEQDAFPFKLYWYERLQGDKNARIIRNLCRLRTAFELNYKAINLAIRTELKPIFTLHQYIPQDALDQLGKDGITVYKSNQSLNNYIIDVNRYISDRINNCKNIFPDWLKWEYIRNFFIMPDGLTEQGIKKAAEEFYQYKSYYPYQIYVNWTPVEAGNILYNDEKFVRLLYLENQDCFTDLDKVTDASDETKTGIYDFLEANDCAAFAVDCENADPFKLYAMLQSLDKQKLLKKVSKIILYDDIHTSPAWKILDRFTEIPVEHNQIDRIKNDKSLVDMRLAIGVCKEYYEKNTSAFILVSSDSDYWGLISSMTEVQFLVMIEEEKCSPKIKDAFIRFGCTYCCIDDFCTGNSYDIKIQILASEIQRILDTKGFNIYTLLGEAYQTTRVELDGREQEQFYNKYIKNMKLTIDKLGNVHIETAQLSRLMN